MKTMLLKRFATLFILTLIITSCAKENKELMAKDWKAIELVLGGTVVSPDAIGGVYYSFSNDGTFEYTEAGQTQDGTWEVNDKTITLHYNEGGKTVEKQIKEISEDKLTFEGEEHGMLRAVTLVPKK
mgnify:CR=1 FL=1|jgi:hypothetical protein